MPAPDTSSFVWEDRHEKRIADFSCLKLTHKRLSQIKRPRILSLPAAQWHWERSLDEALPGVEFQFSGVERDPSVYHQMVNTSADLNINSNSLYRPVFGGVDSYIDSNPFPFDYVYLDCMGTWGYDKVKWCDELFHNQLFNKNSFLRLTLASNRGHAPFWEEELKGPYSLPDTYRVQDIRTYGREVSDWRLYGIPTFLQQAGKLHGYDVLPMLCTIYHSQPGLGKKSTAQLSYLFKIK